MSKKLLRKSKYTSSILYISSTTGY